MMNWMLRHGKRDLRFLLRKALHQKRVFNKFDVVLIGCPLYLNTSCINALTASDFVPIPMTPSENSTDRIPKLIDTMKHCIAPLNPHLSIAGMILIQTRRSLQSAGERVHWQSVVKRAEDQFSSPIRAFETCARTMTEIRDSKGDFSPAEPGEDRYEVFLALAQEILEVIPNARQQVG